MMKVEHIKIESKEAEIKFPFLAKCKTDGMVIIVTAMDENGEYSGSYSGFVIVPSKNDPIGKHLKTWNEAIFTPLPIGEKIILEND